MLFTEYRYFQFGSFCLSNVPFLLKKEYTHNKVIQKFRKSYRGLAI